MSKVKNHGKVDFDCEYILKKIIPKTKKELFPDYDDPEYWKYRQQDLGFRKMMAQTYNTSGQIIHYRYSWESIMPESFFATTKLKKDPIAISVYAVMPGKFVTPHKDEYGGFDTQKPNVAPTRIWIPLTEPSLGHALFFDDEVVYNIEPGTILELQTANHMHSACNAGYKPRVIMTITGVKEDG